MRKDKVIGKVSKKNLVNIINQFRKVKNSYYKCLEFLRVVDIEEFIFVYSFYCIDFYKIVIRKSGVVEEDWRKFSLAVQVWGKGDRKYYLGLFFLKNSKFCYFWGSGEKLLWIMKFIQKDKEIRIIRIILKEG